MKIDVADGRAEVWSEPGCYPGEPVFVAAPGPRDEDGGVILSVVLDAAARRARSCWCWTRATSPSWLAPRLPTTYHLASTATSPRRWHKTCAVTESRSPRAEVASGRPVDPNLRASQAERDRVVDSLRRHAGEGRLDVEELEDRVERALTGSRAGRARRAGGRPAPRTSPAAVDAGPRRWGGLRTGAAAAARRPGRDRVRAPGDRVDRLGCRRLVVFCGFAVRGLRPGRLWPLQAAAPKNRSDGLNRSKRVTRA